MTADKLGGRKTLKVASILDEFEKDRVKADVDIVGLFSSFGVALEKKGQSYVGRCPWHEDTTPSLSVNREKGLYNCFGCGESGDAFSLVEKMKGIGFKESLEYLKAGKFPIPILPKAPKAIPEKLTLKPPVPVDTSRLLSDVAKRYSEDLTSSSEARTYLASRGLDLPEVIKTFGLGYSAGKLSESLSQAQKKALTEIGILSEAGREHFELCITVPLKDEEGKIVGFYGRRTDGRKSSAKLTTHLYLKGEHKGLVNREAAKVYRNSIILTEAVLDALSLYALGIRNVIPCYGVNGFTRAHEELFKAERVVEAVIAFDSDDAGRKGAAALAGRLTALGVAVKTIENPHGKDWNDFLLGDGSKAEFELLLEGARVFEGSQVKKPELVMSRESGRVVFTREDARYRLSGVREGFQASLRVGVRLEHEGRSYVDTVDFYSNRSRSSFALSASQVGLESSRIEADILLMLDALEEDRDRRLMTSDEGPRELTEDEKWIGVEFLSDPALFDRIIEDLSSLGYVGEDVNKLLVYLAASSRKLSDPISVIVSSQSAAGKSYLIDTVKKLIPDEDVISMTSLSDQALNYLPDDALLHKFLVMGEAVHSESVEHQIREMLSAKELARLVTVKDEKTGEMQSRLVRKEVLVSMVMSTTREDVNPENSSRCFVVAADESEGQTKAIHESQRRKYSLEKLSSSGETVSSIINRHKAAQRLLRNVRIVNPYAHLVDFPSRLMRTRRDNERFLDLIASVCFLRQYQKEVNIKSGGFEYVECDLEDYKIAYRLMASILPLTLSNFPAAACSLYSEIRSLIRKKAEKNDLSILDAEVTQREIREASGLSQMAVKRNVRTLVDYEFLIASGFSKRGARRGYRLVRDEELSLVDLSSIPTPKELFKNFQNLQSGSSGSDRVKSGSDPLLGV